MKIHILSDEMASRIAAGEVVERPASVVKELIENSLDAGATEISISIEKSGTTLIRVADNGEGMGPEDLTLAVERHATSKLRDEEDLFRVATLGFRGEALPSIGSVARMEITSRPPTSETGYRIRVQGGKKDTPFIVGSSVGTSVEIKEIFFNTPARRKFLKSPATELSHICDAVNRMALAHPEVHFRLSHDGRMIADYVAVSERMDRLHQVLGREIARDLIPFSSARGQLAISGYLSSAPASFPNTRYLMTFVNRRFVRDKVVTHAVLHGYETLLMKGQYPAAIVFLEVPCAEVDVNVHPAKYEVRFRRPSERPRSGCRRDSAGIETGSEGAAGSRASDGIPGLCRRHGSAAPVHGYDAPTRQALREGRNVSDGREPCRIDARRIFLLHGYSRTDSWAVT